MRQVTVPREDGSLKSVIPEAAVFSLMRYTSLTLAAMPAYAMTHRQGVEAVATWISVTDPLRDVPYTRWLTEEGHCWRRIPFDLVPNDGPQSLCPTWDDLMGKVADKESLKAFLAWVGSLFFKESYRQQYVWIYSQGGLGKGAITRFLHNVFGMGAHFISTIPKNQDRFWTSQLVDKRLIVVPDCDNAKFPSSGLFKTLSGNDPITVEPKHRPAYTTVLDGKFLFTSNHLPELSSESADLRRAIFVELVGAAAWDPGFEDRLWQEGGAFLWDCIVAYAAMCPAHGPIPIGDNESLKAWVSTIEEAEEVIWEKWFELDPEKYVTAADMKKILEIEWPMRRKPQLTFLTWMLRVHGIRKGLKMIIGPSRSKVYPGIRLKLAPSQATRSFYDNDDISGS